jgi:hypothetical protein
VRNKGRRPQEKMRGKDREVTNSSEFISSSFKKEIKHAKKITKTPQKRSYVNVILTTERESYKFCVEFYLAN